MNEYIVYDTLINEYTVVHGTTSIEAIRTYLANRNMTGVLHRSNSDKAVRFRVTKVDNGKSVGRRQWYSYEQV